MAKAAPALLQHFLALCADHWAPVRSRAMFGGYGLYRDDKIFAIYAEDKIYLKTDAQTRPRFDAEQLEPFVFVSKDGTAMSMSYCRLAEAAFDDPDVLREWLQLAWRAALAAPLKKSAAAKPRSKKK